jgi:CubicO group peptidase (beta-lactamase class C family)
MKELFTEKTVGTAIYIAEKEKSSFQIIEGFRNVESREKVDENTNFRMASVSKQFTSACIIILKNNKLINYSDTLARFFPNFVNGEKITLWHLLTHTSGLCDYETIIPKSHRSPVSDADVLNWVSKAETLYFQPGTQYRYSNTGFCILSQIVAQVSGLSFPDFMRKYIFSPLDMSLSAVYEADKYIANRAFGYKFNQNEELILNDQSLTSATQGDGCVYTSLSDYQKWMSGLRQNTLFNIKEEFLGVNYRICGQNGLHYGLGWFNYKNDDLYHTGSTCGFSNAVWMTLSDNNSAIYFSNLSNNHLRADEICLKNRAEFSFQYILELTD